MPAHDPQHAVQFYGNEATLFSSVAAFLSQGLIDGQPTLLVATPDHAAAILHALGERMIDVNRALNSGNLIVLDTDRTLAQFMVGNEPDPDAFEASVGALFARLVRKRSEHSLIRVYGEMVDVLWKQGRADAALRLEEMWNKLAGRYGFTLLCGYEMTSFVRHPELFEEVCRQHTHIMPSQTPVVAPLSSADIQ